MEDGEEDGLRAVPVWFAWILRECGGFFFLCIVSSFCVLSVVLSSGWDTLAMMTSRGAMPRVMRLEMEGWREEKGK